MPVLGEVGRDRLLQFEPSEPEPRSSVRGNNPDAAPAGSANWSPVVTASNGWSPWRSSTIQSVSGSRPGTGVESRSSSFAPSARVAGNAAARVADVLTTRRSPAARNCGRSRKHPWTTLRVLREETSRRTLSREPSRASAGSCASRRARSWRALKPTPPRGHWPDRAHSADHPRSAL